MRKIYCYICSLILLLSVMVLPVSAQSESLSFLFELTADGKSVIEVEKGDIITVVFRLHRTDASAQYTMYAMQNEIRYDSTFFELVEDSVILNHGVVSTDIAMVDQYREFYMNYLSTSGGEQWDASAVVGSIQLRVIGEMGTTTITNQDYLVSKQDGSDSYPCEAQDLTVVLSTACTVSFETNGGNVIPDVTTQFGEKLRAPDAPVREGFDFVGWYKDIHLTDLWDFENDVVQGNMRLYAKWREAVDPEEPDANGNCCWCWLILLMVILFVLWLLHRKHHKNKVKRKKGRYLNHQD